MVRWGAGSYPLVNIHKTMEISTIFVSKRTWLQQQTVRFPEATSCSFDAQPWPQLCVGYIQYFYLVDIAYICVYIYIYIAYIAHMAYNYTLAG